MRIFPIIVAILVAGALYLAVLERDRLVDFATGPTAGVMRADNGTGQDDETAADAAVGDASAPRDQMAGTDPGAAQSPVGVVVVASSAQSIDNGVLVRGRTAAIRSVDVRAETSALVIVEPKPRGSEVETDEILCELDPGTRMASLAEAQARREEARINFRAADRLSQDGFASETRAASARAALQSAEAAVEAAEREIGRLTIKAPFAGLLETDSAELGTLLQPGALCATVIRLDPILLVGFVPEADVDRIEAGARAGARLTSGRQVAGEVTFVSRAADPQTRTFRVEVTVPNRDLSIRDGQTAEILVASSGVSAHLLPGSALTLNDDGALGVRIVDDESRARFAPVRMLRDTVEGVWVAGLPDEAAVIVVGQEYVVDGVPVTPTLREDRP